MVAEVQSVEQVCVCVCVSVSTVTLVCVVRT